MIINYTQDSWGRAPTEIIEKHRENIEINLFLIAGNFPSSRSASDRITKLRFYWPNALIMLLLTILPYYFPLQDNTVRLQTQLDIPPPTSYFRPTKALYLCFVFYHIRSVVPHYCKSYFCFVFVFVFTQTWLEV